MAQDSERDAKCHQFLTELSGRKTFASSSN
jgi:hypothetical protein